MGSVMYDLETVKVIALAAYRAGFEGPLELADEAVTRVIDAHANRGDSDGSLLAQMGEIKPVPKYQGRRHTVPATQNAYAAYPAELQEVL